MAVLWAFIGMNPVYEILCGTAELMGGVLLLFRRTALFGALTTAFVVTNVVLYNLCFDVPVKPYSVQPLLLALFVTLPDAGQLIRFFWLHKPAAPTGIWVPPASRPWFRRTTVGIEVGFTLLALGGGAYEAMQSWRTTHAARVAPGPLRGVWRVDSATLVSANGNLLPHAVLSADHGPSPSSTSTLMFVLLSATISALCPTSKQRRTRRNTRSSSIVLTTPPSRLRPSRLTPATLP